MCERCEKNIFGNPRLSGNLLCDNVSPIGKRWSRRRAAALQACNELIGARVVSQSFNQTIRARARTSGTFAGKLVFSRPEAQSRGSALNQSSCRIRDQIMQELSPFDEGFDFLIELMQ